VGGGVRVDVGLCAVGLVYMVVDVFVVWCVWFV